MSDKKFVVTPENCGKKGKITTTGRGCQITHVIYRCGDRINCGVCRYIFTETEGRLPAIEQAIADGASVYAVSQEDWKTVRQAADRSGQNGDYIKFTHQDTIYFITHAPEHPKSRVLEPALINFSVLLAESTGNTYFRGKYDRYNYTEMSRRDRREKDFVYNTYFPIFKHKRTGNLIPPEKIAPIYLAHMFINPKFGVITSDNVQDFMIWRAEVMASVVLLNDANMSLFAFYVEEKKEIKEDLDAGQAVTNRRIPESFPDGPEIDSAQTNLIMAITFGEHPPLYKLKDFPVVKGNWNTEDGAETVFEQRMDDFEDYGINLDKIEVSNE